MLGKTRAIHKIISILKIISIKYTSLDVNSCELGMKYWVFKWRWNLIEGCEFIFFSNYAKWWKMIPTNKTKIASLNSQIWYTVCHLQLKNRFALAYHFSVLIKKKLSDALKLVPPQLFYLANQQVLSNSSHANSLGSHQEQMKWPIIKKIMSWNEWNV